MRTVVASIEGEYRRYKSLAEKAIGQLSAAQLAEVAGNTGNSVATIVWHLAGNLRSRFTDFLTTDGEKPWRHREEEFQSRHVTHEELLGFWEQGWTVLLSSLAELTDEHLEQAVTIRNQSLSVIEALLRSLAHTSYHVGQIVFLGKALRGSEWTYLSIPPGQSAEYNKQPAREKPPQAPER